MLAHLQVDATLAKAKLSECQAVHFKILYQQVG